MEFKINDADVRNKRPSKSILLVHVVRTMWANYPNIKLTWHGFKVKTWKKKSLSGHAMIKTSNFDISCYSYEMYPQNMC